MVSERTLADVLCSVSDQLAEANAENERLQAECARLAGERDAARAAFEQNGRALAAMGRRLGRAQRWAWGFRRLARNWEWMAAHHIERLLAAEERIVAQSASIDHWLDVVHRKDGEWNDLLAERDALRAALKLYGQHDMRCAYWKRSSEPLRPCTCGLDAALNAAPDARSAGSAPLETDR